MFRFHERDYTILSDVLDLLTVATTSIIIPENKKFAVDEVGLVLDQLTGAITSQPTISFGFTGTPAGILAAVTTTQMSTVLNRERYLTLLNNHVLSTLNFSVTSAGVGPSVYKARVYFRGLIY